VEEVDVVVGDDATEDGVGALGVGVGAGAAGAGATADEGAGGAAFLVAAAFFVVAAFFTFFSFLGLSSTPGCLNSAGAATKRQKVSKTVDGSYGHTHTTPPHTTRAPRRGREAIAAGVWYL
jgi:hypothetical protein